MGEDDLDFKNRFFSVLKIRIRKEGKKEVVEVAEMTKGVKLRGEFRESL